MHEPSEASPAAQRGFHAESQIREMKKEPFTQQARVPGMGHCSGMNGVPGQTRHLDRKHPARVSGANKSSALSTAMKADRKRLKGEKTDLVSQMQQLYATLESREEQLRDFIRNYEQHRKVGVSLDPCPPLSPPSLSCPLFLPSPLRHTQSHLHSEASMASALNPRAPLTALVSSSNLNNPRNPGQLLVGPCVPRWTV